MGKPYLVKRYLQVNPAAYKPGMWVMDALFHGKRVAPQDIQSEWKERRICERVINFYAALA